MKIIFTELPTSGGKIQVSFDGGSTFKDFNGTEEEWNAIDKGAGWNSYCPSDMVINYNYQG